MAHNYGLNPFALTAAQLRILDEGLLDARLERAFWQWTADRPSPELVRAAVLLGTGDEALANAAAADARRAAEPMKPAP